MSKHTKNNQSGGRCGHRPSTALYIYFFRMAQVFLESTKKTNRTGDDVDIIRLPL